MQSPDMFRRYVPGALTFFVGLVVAFFVSLVVFSLYLRVVSYALLRLGLSHHAMLLALAGILVGGAFNIPLRRTKRTQLQLAEWGAFYRRWGEGPFPIGVLQGHTIAINIGGAIMPLLIAFVVAGRLIGEPFVLLMLSLASLVNIFVCNRLGRIIADVGIMLPGWVAPLIGILGAWLLLPAGSPHYASFAFVTAVVGPFVGADLMNLQEARRLGTGTLSIGGAGPIDGIVLSGILAALLA